MKPWHHVEEKIKQQPKVIMLITDVPQTKHAGAGMNGVLTIGRRARSMRRCAFDMHHRYTINIFGLGWRLLVPLVSIACDRNRWSPPFSQAPPPLPAYSPTGVRLPPALLLPPSLNNHQQCTPPPPNTTTTTTTPGCQKKRHPSSV